MKYCSAKMCEKKGILQSLENFYPKKQYKDGLEYYCKDCCRKKSLESYYKNHENNKERANHYRLENIEQHANNLKKWRQENKEHVRDYEREYRSKKINESFDLRIKRNLRVRLSKALINNQKSGSAVSDLKCTISQLREWLEQQFQEKMTWENYGHGKDKWNIDHIIPLSKFDLTDRQQFLKACHWFNLRPMWQSENSSRGNRINA